MYFFIRHKVTSVIIVVYCVITTQCAYLCHIFLYNVNKLVIFMFVFKV